MSFSGCSSGPKFNVTTIRYHEYQQMTTQRQALVYTAILGAVLALSSLQATAAAPSARPPGQAVHSQNPEETAEESKNKKKKKQQREQAEQQPQQQQEQQDRKRQPEQQQPHQEPQRQQQLKEKHLQQAQQERQLQQKRVSQQEQRERIRTQEQQLALYRKNIALREELAERDAQVLRRQKRIQHLRFQERYEERLRAQRAQLIRVRYDYYNDPFYYTAPNYGYHRDGRYYRTNQYGIRQMERALQAGYNEGFWAGRADREDRWRYDYRSAFAYRDANYGYDGRYIDQYEYNYYFRQGFQRGYEDGYYGRQSYGRRNYSDSNNDEWLIFGAVVAAIIGYELLTD